jgi:cytochrome c-type biogenesis protein CcmH
MIWALLAVLAIVVVAVLVWPLVRERPVRSEEHRDIVVLKDQLAEVERERVRGTMTATEADAIRLEIQRRLLAAGRRAVFPAWREGPGLRAGLTAALAIIVPMAAFAIYMNLGAPMLRPAPTTAAAPVDKDMAVLVEQLAARMQAEPGNIEGWSLLARSYRQIERYQDALNAYAHVLTLKPEMAEPYANFGEMAVTVAGGRVGPPAREAFTTALQRDRSEPRARFYLGLAAAQDGDARTAIAIWRELTASAPPDAPWLEMVRNQMFQVAQSGAVMPMSVEPRHPLDGAAPAASVSTTETPQPLPADPNDITAPDVTAIKGQFSGENLAQIQAMVGSLAGRLENEPEDYNGWLMLGRSYTVLRDSAGAKRAFEKAIALKPGDIQPKLNYAAVLLGETDINGPSPLPAPVVKINDDILKLSPDQPEALFVRGLAAYKAGNTLGARKDWTAAKTKAQGALASDLERRLKALK